MDRMGYLHGPWQVAGTVVELLVEVVPPSAGCLGQHQTWGGGVDCRPRHLLSGRLSLPAAIAERWLTWSKAKLTREYWQLGGRANDGPGE